MSYVASWDHLADLLRLRAERDPHALAYRFLETGDLDGPARALTHEELDRRARAIAAALRERRLRGETILLLHPQGLEFIAAFFGCLYSGNIAVTAYPPDPHRLERSVPRLEAIAVGASAALALTTRQVLGSLQSYRELAPRLASIEWIASDEIEDGCGDGYVAGTPHPVAFLQYTSGSTGRPKGVTVTHANLKHNLEQLRAELAFDRMDAYVSWAPLFHDLGLIGVVLEALYAGVPCTLMSPMAFLRKPLRWLEAMTHFGAGVSGAPNFGYDLCVQRIGPDELARLDLSRWKVAYNGAEPVRPATLQNFAARFGEAGFDERAFSPAYGLAEATLIVSCIRHDDRARWHTFDAEALGRGEVVPARGEGLPLVSCGVPFADQDVRIVDPETGAACGEGAVGEIWVRSQSVARGYWRDEEATEATFAATLAGNTDAFLRTGDLGFFYRGELYVAGRLKDLIIVRGANYYPQDLEATVEEAHAGVRRGCVAAFPLVREDEEQVGVAAEVYEEVAADRPDEVVDAIRRAVALAHDLHVDTVALLPPRSLPKTSSGKLQRRACRLAIEQGRLEALAIDRHGAGLGATAESGTPFVPAGACAPGAGPSELLALEGKERERAVRARLAQLLDQHFGVPAERLRKEHTLGRLGVDSLRRVDLMLAVEASFGREFPAEHFGAEVTLAELSALVCDRLAQTAPAPGIDEREECLEGSLPLLHTQRSSLLGDGWGSRGCAITVELDATEPIDAALLRRALEGLERRHEALRLRVAREGDRQEIGPAGGGASLHVIPASELARLEPDEARAALARRLEGGFDLQSGPHLQAIYLKGAPAGQPPLIVAVHNHVADAVSVALLLADLNRLYAQLAAGVDVPRSQATLLRWLRAAEARASSLDFDTESRYWARACEGSAPAAESVSEERRTGAHELEEDSTRRFQRLLPSSTEQHDAILAALAFAWSEHRGESELSIVLEQHGRRPLPEAPDVSKTVGQFVYRYPLRLDRVDASLPARVLYQRVRAAQAAVPDQGRSFGLLAYLHPDERVRRRLQELPVPPLRLSYQTELVDPARQSGTLQLRRHGLIVPDETRRRRTPRRPHVLTVLAEMSRSRLRWVINYKRDHLGDAEVERIARNMQHFLSSLVA